MKTIIFAIYSFIAVIFISQCIQWLVADFYYSRAIIFRLQKYQPITMLMYLDTAYSLAPNDIQINHFKVEVLCALGEYEEALKAIDEGLQRYPYYYPFWHLKGEIYKIQKKFKLAVLAYKEAINIFPLYSKPQQALVQFKKFLKE